MDDEAEITILDEGTLQKDIVLASEDSQRAYKKTRWLHSVISTLVRERVGAGLTQTTLAKTMGKSQPAIARLESNDDLKLSTLWDYCQGIGKTPILDIGFQKDEQLLESMNEEFTGKFFTRVPQSLHRDLAIQAREENMSLNSFVMHLLSSRSIQARLENLVVSAISSQPSVRYPSHAASGSHNLLFGEVNPFTTDGSGPNKRQMSFSNGRERSDNSGHTLNPKLRFAG